MAEVVEAVQLMEDFDLHDGGVGWTVRSVRGECLWGLAEEVVVLRRGDGVDSHWVFVLGFTRGIELKCAMLTS